MENDFDATEPVIKTKKTDNKVKIFRIFNLFNKPDFMSK